MKLILKAFFAVLLVFVLTFFLSSESESSVIQIKNDKKTTVAPTQFNSIKVERGSSLNNTTNPFVFQHSTAIYKGQIAIGSNTVESIDFGVHGFDGVVTIKTSEPVNYEELPKKEKRFDLRLSNVYLPDELQVSRDVNEFTSPVGFISTFRDPIRKSDVVVVIELIKDTTAELEQQGNVINIRFKQQNEDDKLRVSQPQPYSPKQAGPTDLNKENTLIQSMQPIKPTEDKKAESKLPTIPSIPKGISHAGINIVEGVGFKVKKGVGVLSIKTSWPVEYEELPSDKNKFNLKLVNVFLPDELQDSRKVNNLESPVSIVSTFRDNVRQGDVIVVVESKENLDTEFNKEENLLTIKFTKSREKTKTGVAKSQPQPTSPKENAPTGVEQGESTAQENPPIKFQKMVTIPGIQASGAKPEAQLYGPKEYGRKGLNTIENIYFKAQNGVGNVTIKTLTPVEYEEIVKEKNQLTLKLEGTSLSDDLEIARDVNDIDSPVSLFSSFRESGKKDNVIVIVELKDNVPFQLNQDGKFINLKFGKSKGEEKFVEEIQAASETSSYPVNHRIVSKPVEKKTNHDQLVSFDFKDADIRDVLKILTDVSGFSFVVSEDVRGTVTLKLNSLPWDKALDIVLESAGLSAVVEGTVIKVTPLTTVRAGEKAAEQISPLKEQHGTLSSKQIFVNYTSADKIIPLIKPLLSSRGGIKLDVSTNSLLITDIESVINQIEEHIKSLDIKTPQVLIEARIVQAGHNFTPQLGVDWRPNYFDSTAFMYPRNSFLPSSTLKEGSAPEDLKPLSAAANNSLLDIPKAGNKGLDGAFRLILGTITGIFDLDMKLSEFEKWGYIRVLSSPNISTLDNNPARIEQVVSIPLMDGSAAGIKDKLVDTNLTFEITPNVTNDKKVLMEIEVTDNYPDPSITEKGGQSVIRKNKVGTQILAMGGETVVVRCLFTNIEAVDKQNEFFVFLTPWIIK